MHEKTRRAALFTGTKKDTSSAGLVAPVSLRVQPKLHDRIAVFHRTIGNQAVGRLIQRSGVGSLEPGVIRSKLSINKPDDIYEQEADRVADQVMAGPDLVRGGKPILSGEQSVHSLQRSCLECTQEGIRASDIQAKGSPGHGCGSAPEVGREEEEKETTVQGKDGAAAPMRNMHDLSTILAGTRGGGRLLPDATRAFMESRFGRDFSRVRVHADGRAQTMTNDLSAEAFTSRNDIYFGASRYRPETFEGKKLLAHELAHVVQQSGISGHGAVLPRRSSSQENSVIQCYRLRGFPPAEKAAMKAAIPSAIATVKSCSYLTWLGKRLISWALNNKRYDYKKDLGYCGWTFPASWYIEVGKEAFDRNICCDLPSTLAHEAAHTEWYTEGRARKMECKCFGCSC